MRKLCKTTARNKTGYSYQQIGRNELSLKKGRNTDFSSRRHERIEENKANEKYN